MTDLTCHYCGRLFRRDRDGFYLCPTCDRHQFEENHP